MSDIIQKTGGRKALNDRQTFNFDAPPDRRQSGSLKWDVGKDELPMWVADMDFQTAPAVVEAVTARARAGVYGYTIVPERWYDVVIGWWKARHNVSFQRDWLCFCTGVVPAITSAVKRLTNAGDKVVVQTPVYDIFFHSVENTGRTVLENRLTYENGNYAVDFDDLEQKLSDPLATMLILCNPHNPVGRIWTKEEFARIGALCEKYGVTVLSDEIHCDLTDPGAEYTPYIAATPACAKNSVTCVSASKAFNLAGLQSAAVVVPDENLRHKIVRGLNSDELAEPNCFAAESAIAAFEKGAPWLDALREYLFENKRAAVAFIERELPFIAPVRSQATYLLWLDCGKITEDSDELCAFLRRKTGLYLSAGGQYRGNGGTFLRMNLACPKARLQDGLQRFSRGIQAYREEKNR